MYVYRLSRMGWKQHRPWYLGVTFQSGNVIFRMLGFSLFLIEP